MHSVIHSVSFNPFYIHVPLLQNYFMESNSLNFYSTDEVLVICKNLPGLFHSYLIYLCILYLLRSHEVIYLSHSIGFSLICRFLQVSFLFSSSLNVLWYIFYLSAHGVFCIHSCVIRPKILFSCLIYRIMIQYLQLDVMSFLRNCVQEMLL